MTATLAAIELPRRADAPAARSAAALEGRFVVGPENRLAEATVARTQALAGQADRELLSPLVFYGPAGSGKTHLAEGLAAWWRSARPRSAVQVTTAREFADRLSAVARRGELEKWRGGLRGAELLVIEDVQQLATRRAAQQELWHLLDAAADRGSLVVLTLRGLPSQVQGLLAGLRGRMTAGLVVPLSLPSPATRRALVERLAKARGLQLPARLLAQLADQYGTTVEALCSALAELEGLAGDGPLDAERWRRLMAASRTRQSLTLRGIATNVAKYFRLRLADLKSASRRQSIVQARGVAIYLARQLTDQSLQQIGSYFGGRDHTTVLNGYRRIERLSKRDPALRVAVEELTEQVLAG